MSIEFPVGVFMGVHGNVPTLQKIINVFKDRKVKNTFCLGDSLSIGDPKKILELLDRNITVSLLGVAEDICTMKEEPIKKVYPLVLWHGNIKTREIIKQNRLEKWFQNKSKMKKIDNFFFASEFEEFVCPHQVSKSEYIFLKYQSSIIFRRTETQKIFYLRCFSSSVSSEILVLHKKYFEVISIPFDFEYALKWSYENIRDKKIITTLEELVGFIQTSKNRQEITVKKFGYDKDVHFSHLK